MNTPISFSGKRVLVTGAAGFIGSHLCRRLGTLGGEIHALDTVNRPREVDFPWRQSDLADPSKVRGLVRSIKPDIIYHLGSYVTGSRDAEIVVPVFQSNLSSTVNLLSAAEAVGCQRLILAGSMEEPRSGENDFVSVSPYAVAKWASSTYARMYNVLYGVPIVILHLFMVYGPGQKDATKLVPYVIRSLLRNEAPKISSGMREIDWVYIDDVIDAFLRSAQAKDIQGQTIEIGSGRLIPIKRVVKKIVDLVRPGIKPEWGALPDRLFECSKAADTRRAFRMLGWKCQTGLDEGLRRTALWFRKNMPRGGSMRIDNSTHLLSKEPK